MPKLPEIPVTFDWGAVDTVKSDRKIQIGELTDLVNVRRAPASNIDGGTYLVKRNGHDRNDISTFVGASYASPNKEMIPSDSVLFRDSIDQIWAVDGDHAYYRGTDVRAFPTWYQTKNLAQGAACSPQMVEVGSDLWLFTMADANHYQLTVVDPVTHIVKTETLLVTATAIACWSIVAVGSTVWVFWIENVASSSAPVHVHKFTSPTSSPTTTNLGMTTGALFTSIDATVFNGTTVFVAASQMSIGATIDVTTQWCYLNQSTGVAASPGVVSHTHTGPAAGTQMYCGGGVGIVDWDLSDGFIYFTHWRTATTPDFTIELVSQKINKTTLALTSTVTVDTITNPEFILADIMTLVGLSTGHRVGSTNYYQAGYVQLDANGALVKTQRCVTWGYSDTAGTVAKTFTARSASLASKSFYIGPSRFDTSSVRYFLTSFDDGAETRAQRTYWLRDMSGKLITSVLLNQGTEALFASQQINANNGGNLYPLGGPVVSPVELNQSTFFFPLLAEGFTANSPEPTIAKIDWAATYFSTVPGVVPGGIPKTVSAQDDLTEMTPLQFPFEAAAVLPGDGADTICTSRYTWLYARIDSANNIVPSAPYPTQEQVFKSFSSYFQYTISIPTARHAVGQLWIQLYASPPDGTDLFLQQQFLNDPTVDAIAVVIDPTKWDDKGEELSQTAGTVVNNTVPPARLAFGFQDRVCLAGTPDDSIWPSRELVPGHGAEFAPAFAFSWHRGSGPVRGAGSIGRDALVLFRDDAVGVVTGLGPDGLGNGGYVVSTVETGSGCSNPASIVTGPGPGGSPGVYFQRNADGRFCVCQGGQPVEVGGGAEKFLSYRPAGAVLCQTDRVIRWYCGSAILALDYAHPNIDGTQGQWYLYSSPAFNGWAGVQGIGETPLFSGSSTIGVVPVALETSGPSIWVPNSGYDDHGTVVTMSMRTGRMSPPGFMNEFDLSEVRLSSFRVGGNSTFNYNLYDDQGNVEFHSDVASNVPDVAFRSGLNRIREVSLEIVESTATGAGRAFDGVGLIVRPYGRFQTPYRRIA